MTRTPFFVVVTCLATFLAACDGKPVGKGTPGPVTQKLRKAYRELTSKECG